MTEHDITYNNQQYVHQMLQHMGCVKPCKAFQRLERMLVYIAENQTILEEKTLTYLYIVLADSLECQSSAIERSLRYAIAVIWDNNAEQCSRLFYRSPALEPRPSVKEFLHLFVSAYQRNVVQDWVDSLEMMDLE